MSQKIESLRELIEPAITALGLGVFVWGIEFQSGSSSATLRIYIDALERPVNLDDCEAVSREVSALLDVHDPIAGNYRLEISSPGIDRPLFESAHYQRYIGEQAKLSLAAPIGGRRRLSGRIVRADAAQVAIESEGGVFDVGYDNILGARLMPVFPSSAKAAPRKKPGRGKRP